MTPADVAAELRAARNRLKGLTICRAAMRDRNAIKACDDFIAREEGVIAKLESMCRASSS